MQIQSYDDLIEAVKDYTLRSDAPVELFIGLAESELKPVIKHYLAETVVEIPIVNQEITIPTDFLEARSIKVGNLPTRQLGIYDNTICAGEVGYKRVGKKLAFVGANDGDLVEIVYTAKFPSLSETQPSNWLLENFPAVYLHATLVRAYRWATDDKAEAVEKQSLNEAISLLVEDNRKGTAPAAPSSFGGSAW